MSEAQYEPETLAQEYLDALDQEIDEGHRHGLETKREELRDRRERYVDQHGEDSSIVQRVDEKIEEVEYELEEFDTSAQQVEGLRDRLLESAKDEFEFNSEWLSSTTLEGLTHALYGKREDHLIIDQVRIQEPDVLTDIDDIDQLDMEHTLLLLIEDRLGETNTVNSRWERFSDSKYHIPFLIVARDGVATPDDVLPELEDDADRDDAKNWLNRPLYDWEDLIPYYRPDDGEMALSTTGKYLARHYAETLDEIVGVDEGEGDDENRNDNGQTSLDDINDGNAGDSDE